MMADYMCAFVRLKRTDTPDGLGGTRTEWAPDKVFTAGTTAQAAQEITPGGLTEARTRTVLIHLPGIELAPGDVVQRVFDGMTWRVLGSTSDMTMPRTGCGQVPVERVVKAL